MTKKYSNLFTISMIVATGLMIVRLYNTDIVMPAWIFYLITGVYCLILWFYNKAQTELDEAYKKLDLLYDTLVNEMTLDLKESKLENKALLNECNRLKEELNRFTNG